MIISSSAFVKNLFSFEMFLRWNWQFLVSCFVCRFKDVAESKMTQSFHLRTTRHSPCWCQNIVLCVKLSLV